MLATIFTKGFNIHLENSNVILCKIFYYVSFLFATLSPTTLIWASIDRLFISSQNTNLRFYSSHRLAYFTTSVNTICWLIFSIHALIKIGIYNNNVCYYDLEGIYFQFVSISTLCIGSIASIILIILVIITFKNVRQIRSIPRQQIRPMHRKDFQLLRCLYAHDVSYIFFTSFIGLYYVYDSATKNSSLSPVHQAVKKFLDDFTLFLCHIFYCVSFLIFISISKAFRHDIKQIISTIFCRKSPPNQTIALRR